MTTTLIRLPATPREVKAGKPIWYGSGIVKRVTRRNSRKPVAK